MGGGGHKLFFQKSEKQKKKKKKKKGHSGVKAQDRGGAIVDRGRAYNLMHFLLTIGLCSICIKIVLKGGLGVLPQKIFTKLGTKLGCSRHF